MKKSSIIIIILAVFILVACGEVAPMADSDSGQNFANTNDSRIPVDRNAYRISGKVIGDVDSLSQTNASTRVVPIYNTYVPVVTFDTSGKGFVRLFIYGVEPSNDLVTSEEIAILKTTDTKARALLPGDVVTFICRAQFEAVAAVLENEVFDPVKLGTWEFDYCRLERPAITIEEGR